MDVTSIRISTDAAVKQQQYVPQPEAASRRELIKAAAIINRTGGVGEKSELVFVIDPTSRKAVMELVDRNTREVVMQLPPEYVLRLAAEAVKRSESFSPAAR